VRTSLLTVPATVLPVVSSTLEKCRRTEKQKAEKARSMFLRRFALFLIGFTATSAQILLLREFISTFHGNELVIGVYLSVWLLATAAGSGPIARLLLRARGSLWNRGVGEDDDRAATVRFALAQSLSGTCLLFAVVGLLGLPGPLRPAPGEVPGLTAALAAAAIFLFPFCLLQGVLFSLGATLFGSKRLEDSVSSVYLLESLGAGTGGLFFGLVLIHLLSSFQNVALLSSVNLFAACFLLNRAEKRRLSQVLYVAASLIVILCVVDPVTHWAASQRWKGLRIVALKQSDYGNLAVVSIDSQFTLYEDGFPIFTTDDIQSAEEGAHIPLLEHPAPARVLLMGGGTGGVVHEMLKHRTLVRLDYLELDPQIIELSRAVLPRRYLSGLDDSRVAVTYTDGRRFLERTRERYDVVAALLPPPYTAQLNRFYTKEFFTLVRQHLSRGGILVFSAPGVADYVGGELAAFLNSLSRTSRSVFGSSVMIPVNRTFFACSPDSNHYVSASPESLLSRLESRKIQTSFMRDYFLTSTLSEERLRYVSQRVTESGEVPINADLKPISFYYDLILWSAEYERFMKGFLEWIFKNSWVCWVAAAAFASAALAMAGLRKRGALVLSALAVSGFAAIVLELEILLCFQLLYGSLYDRIGVLLSSYMIGLAIGVAIERRKSRLPGGQESALRRTAAIQFLTAAFALCFLGFVYVLVEIGSGGSASPAGAQAAIPGGEVHGFLRLLPSSGIVSKLEIVFPLIAVVAGALGGALFGSASRAFFCRMPPSDEAAARSPVGRATANGSAPGDDARYAGLPYAWDLVGSWLGAILCSVVLFPVLGVAATMAIVFVLLAVSGLSLVWASR